MFLPGSPRSMLLPPPFAILPKMQLHHLHTQYEEADNSIGNNRVFEKLAIKKEYINPVLVMVNLRVMNKDFGNCPLPLKRNYVPSLALHTENYHISDYFDLNMV